jgi:glycosyltransferase involved in cell wall biosynthesis
MKAHPNEPLPFVSVIVPVYNDPRGISETLSSLEQQDYPRNNWEVIVIDNDSSDETRRIACSFIPYLPCMQVLTETRRSSYAARNTGIGLARGGIIAFIDADMVVDKDWITTGVKEILGEEADYVGCRVDIYTKGDPPSIFEIYNQRTGFPVKDYMERFGFAGAGNIFVRRTVFERIGMFDQRLVSGGDYEFGTRVKEAGLKMYYSDKNRMLHPARRSFRSLLRKNIRTAKGYVDLRLLYPDRFGKLTKYTLLIYFVLIPTSLPSCFHDLSLTKKLEIFALQLIYHYTNVTARLAYYTKISRCLTDERNPLPQR